MFKKSLLLFSLFFVTTSFLNAQTISSIVENTYNKNYTLKALEESIKVAKQEIELSSKWTNPTLSFGLTDIQFDEVTRRDLEPMQAAFVGITQSIPLGDKLKISEKIARNDYQISKYLVEEQKLQYRAKIYEYIYNIKLLKERLSLFEEFKRNTLNLENLLKELYKFNKANQAQILNTQIMQQELNLKSQKLKTLLNTITLRLEQITYEKIENIDIDTNIKKIQLSLNIDSHPKILSLMQVSKKFDNLSKLEKEKKNSDIKVSLTYFQRDNKYKDYANLSFAIPLSVYGKEDIKSKKAKFNEIETNHKLEDIKLTFKNQIKTYQQNIEDSIITLNIIKKDILPKYNQLQKVLETYNSFSSTNIDSKSLINNFNEIIKYKLKVLAEKENYFNTLAKSSYYTKEIK
ncbi:MAG: TolC family protein [Halarcobacter sp.]